MSKLVYGVGINDLRYLEKNKGTKEYSLWCDMLRRCYEEKYLERFPTYRGSKVSDEWLIFSNFKRDINSMKNFEKSKEDWVLDKDILSDTKTYSKETCCFIPESLNIFIANIPKEYKATFDKRWNVYYAYCSDVHGNKKYLGRYRTLVEAHKVYSEFKSVVIQNTIDFYQGVLDDKVILNLKGFKDGIL